MKSSNQDKSWTRNPRKIFEDGNLFDGNARLYTAYSFLLSKFAYKECTVEKLNGSFKVNLKAGQCLTSINEINKKSGGSRIRTKSDLNILESNGLILVKQLGIFLLIEDTNFEHFASGDFSCVDFYASPLDQLDHTHLSNLTIPLEQNDQGTNKNNKDTLINLIIPPDQIDQTPCSNRSDPLIKLIKPLLSNKELKKEEKLKKLEKPFLSFENFGGLENFPLPDEATAPLEIPSEENSPDDYFLTGSEINLSIPLPSENDAPPDLDLQGSDDLPFEDMPESDINQFTGDLQTEVIIGFKKNQTGDQNSNLKLSGNPKRSRKRMNKFESIKAHDPKLITLVAAKGDSLVRAHIPDEVAEFTDFEIISPDQNSGQVKKSRSRKKETGGHVEEKSDGAKVFDAYNAAFQRKYNQPAVRNAMVNSLCKQLVTRLGVDDAIRVVEFYLTHNDAFYIKNLHMLKFAVNSAEKLLAEANSGIKMTGQMAQRNERNQNNFDVISRYMMKKHGISMTD
jgi:hypothetical protein